MVFQWADGGLKNKGRVHMTTTVWTAYQGIEVVTSDPIVKCRHAKHGYDEEKLAILDGATLLGLADGFFLVVCNDCGYNGITGREPYVTPPGDPKDQKPIIKQADSVLAHKSGTHWLKKVRGPMYSEEMIKAAIKIWLKWKGTHLGNWGAHAANEFNRLGFKPVFKDQWNADIMGSLVNRYLKHPTFKHIKAAPMTQEDQAFLAEMVRLAAERNGKTGTRVADNARITEKTQKAAETQQEEDVPVVDDGPVLRFVDSKPEPMTLPFKPDLPAHTPLVVLPPVEIIGGDFEFIATLPDGSPMFKYKGDLMVGKLVKDVQI